MKPTDLARIIYQNSCEFCFGLKNKFDTNRDRLQRGKYRQRFLTAVKLLPLQFTHLQRIQLFGWCALPYKFEKHVPLEDHSRLQCSHGIR